MKTVFLANSCDDRSFLGIFCFCLSFHYDSADRVDASKLVNLVFTKIKKISSLLSGHSKQSLLQFPYLRRAGLLFHYIYLKPQKFKDIKISRFENTKISKFHFLPSSFVSIWTFKTGATFPNSSANWKSFVVSGKPRTWSSYFGFEIVDVIFVSPKSQQRSTVTVNVQINVEIRTLYTHVTSFSVLNYVDRSKTFIKDRNGCIT